MVTVENIENEEDDEGNNLENKKYNDKFKYYNYDDNKMYTMYFKNSEIDKVNTSVLP